MVGVVGGSYYSSKLPPVYLYPCTMIQSLQRVFTSDVADLSYRGAITSTYATIFRGHAIGLASVLQNTFPSIFNAPGSECIHTWACWGT